MLSQKLSQLSTDHNTEVTDESTVIRRKRSLSSERSSSQTSVPVRTTVSKKQKQKKEEEEEQEGNNDSMTDPFMGCQLPLYLSREHVSFQTWLALHHHRWPTVKIDDLQQWLFCQHQLGCHQIQCQLVRLYLLSGLGELGTIDDLDQSTIDSRVWPTQVITEMYEQRATTISSIETDTKSCEDFVRRRLEQLEKTVEQYREKAVRIRQQYDDHAWSIDNESIMLAYVMEHGIRPLQLKAELKARLLRHDYRMTLLERAYAAELPTEYQVTK